MTASGVQAGGCPQLPQHTGSQACFGTISSKGEKGRETRTAKRQRGKNRSGVIFNVSLQAGLKIEGELFPSNYPGDGFICSSAISAAVLLAGGDGNVPAALTLQNWRRLASPCQGMIPTESRVVWAQA